MQPASTATRATARAANSHLWMIVLAAILWGTVGISTQTLYHLSATNPLSIGFFRLALATPALACACWCLHGWRSFRVARRDLARMVLLGAMLALYQVCYFAAIALIGVAIATLVTLCLAPVLVALLSVVLFGERLTRFVVLALICALTGIACVVGFQPGQSTQSIAPRGVLLACGSACGYAIVVLAGRSLASRYSALHINVVGFGTGALPLLPLALATHFVIAYPPQGWLLLAYLGLVPSAFAYVLFLTGMRSTPASVTSIVTLLEPLTATILAWLIFGERLGTLGLIGAALLLGAIVILALNQRPAI